MPILGISRELIAGRGLFDIKIEHLLRFIVVWQPEPDSHLMAAGGDFRDRQLVLDPIRGSVGRCRSRGTDERDKRQQTAGK
jgi:hypothetical protein